MRCLSPLTVWMANLSNLFDISPAFSGASRLLENLEHQIWETRGYGARTPLTSQPIQTAMPPWGSYVSVVSQNASAMLFLKTDRGDYGATRATACCKLENATNDLRPRCRPYQWCWHRGEFSTSRLRPNSQADSDNARVGRSGE